MERNKKRADFDRLFPPRGEKVLDAIRVASHCLKSHMDPDPAKLRDFRDGVKEAMEPFNAPKWTGVIQEPPMRDTGFAEVDRRMLAKVAEGGATLESEIRWAIDAIRRGDNKLAISRLQRCLGFTPADK